MALDWGAVGQRETEGDDGRDGAGGGDRRPGLVDDFERLPGADGFEPASNGRSR